MISEQCCVIQHTHLQELAQMCFLDNTLVFYIDEVKVSDQLVLLVISTKINGKVLPLAWHTEQTGGHIPFETQAKLLNNIFDLLPQNMPVILRADYFYGAKSLVAWCQEHQFAYRIRIKNNLLFQHEGATVSLHEAYDMGMTQMEYAAFNKSDITTNIAIIVTSNNNILPNPIFIAMDCDPSAYETLGSGIRQNIESILQNFKLRMLIS